MSIELMNGKSHLSGLDAALRSSTHSRSTIAETEGLRELVQRLAKEVEELRAENERLRKLMFGSGA